MTNHANLIGADVTRAVLPSSDSCPVPSVTDFVPLVSLDYPGKNWDSLAAANDGMTGPAT
jgi:hypothetical protein